MHATTFDSVNSVSLPARPCDVAAKQRNSKEAELIARLKAGDQMAFEALVERYQSKIRNITFGILGNREDADEIAQEVFAKVYFAVPTFDARSSLYTWIYRIAVNECFGFLRKSRLRPVYESDSTDGTLVRMQNVADPRPVTDRAVMQRDFINKLLARVPEDDRLLLLLKEMEGFSLAELSEMTGLNLNTIKVRLFRTRQSLIKAAAHLESPGRAAGGVEILQ
jgi:RNA polymerase sigma-70 factor, ECF subfamily